MSTNTEQSKIGASLENAEAKAREAFNAGKESGQHAIDEVKNAVGAGVHSAQEKVGAAIDKAKETASNVADSVTNAASYAGQKAEDATGKVGAALESTGHYLKEDGLHHMASDMSNMIRRNPMPAMLLGIGLGYLLSQALSRRNA